MELREFAESVLFASTLEEKLRAPGELTDERPGPELVTPAAPGRPANFVFNPCVKQSAHQAWSCSGLVAGNYFS